MSSNDPSSFIGQRSPVTARPSPLFVGSDIYRNPAFGFNHPLNIVRHAAVLDLLGMLRWLDKADFRESNPASVEQLLQFHDHAYIRALQYANATGSVNPDLRERYQVGTFENPLFPGFFERAAMTVGGSILAAELAAAGHVVFHPTGGTHHGRPDRAAGFCYLNDPVFAIMTLLRQGSERVMYLDLDAHHGDGVEEAYYEEPRVTTVSIHEQHRWPFSGTHSHAHAGAFNFSVPPEFNDSEFDYVMQNGVLPLFDARDTDALVICCGADCLAGDPLSHMKLTNVALWDAVDRLIALNVPTVVLGGGGYNPWTVTRYWAGLWGRISGQEIPDSLPSEAREFMRQMECDLIDEEDIEQDWFTTMADSPYPGAIRDEIKLMVEDTRTQY
ncbi:MAG: acetoin utilization protein AcuC [Gammaproteobacteria bacterium]|nr:acetoin utilization protein AcuC [Gammaproteobacteria bacterium]MDH3578918.1 acetoin utilization protein AcuC [Gammaproteobacteria bacterium]